MSATVTIVDYGVGNLFSVRRAIESAGATEVVVTGRAEDIERADRLVLPGVGAFRDGIQGLRERGLASAVVEFARSGRPLLGICLGMQMLADESEEFGRHQGLGLIPGKVVAIPRNGRDGGRLKVPFVGWTTLAVDPAARAGSCLDSLLDDDAVYLVHSFHFVPERRADLLATYDFAGNPITAAVRHDNITGFQFHPEKSGKVGLAILADFIAAQTTAASPVAR
jgi:glutamine amidotransferase